MNDLPEAMAENFLKALGSLGKAAAPVLQRAAPAIAQGALSGASVGGPWGALIGAGAGAASSALGGAKRAPAAAPPARMAPPAAAAPLPTGQPAAATLVSLLQNPTVQKVLTSQVFGASGTPQVTTATGATLPRGAINGLLMQLLANASEGLGESEELSEQSYLQDDSGEYLIDPASSEQQAALVLSHLQGDSVPGFAAQPGELSDTVEWMADAADDWEAEQFRDARRGRRRRKHRDGAVLLMGMPGHVDGFSWGKMLPRILFPYVQQWAERSGMTLVSRLLVDEQFRALLEKYGDEVLTRVAQANQRPPPASGATSGAAYGMANGTANGHANGTANGHAAEAGGLADPPCADPRFSEQVTNGSSLSKLQERVLAMEAQETVLSILRNRMRPLDTCPRRAAPNAWSASRAARNAGAKAGSPTTRPTSACWRRRSSARWPRAACRCS